jgi:hypothetical protein
VPAQGGPEFAPVALDAKTRAGLLTQGSVLALTSGTDRTMPTRRGRWLQKTLLCRQEVPPDIAPVRPPLPAGTSVRSWLTEQTQGYPCNACHGTADPYGFVLGAFDAIGRSQPTFAGQMVDTRATVDLQPTPVMVDGPPGLAKALATSPEAQWCFARSWLSYATGRTLTLDDPSVVLMMQAFSRADSHLSEAIVASVTTKAFLDP